jgi:hypothetical protein
MLQNPALLNRLFVSPLGATKRNEINAESEDWIVCRTEDESARFTHGSLSPHGSFAGAGVQSRCLAPGSMEAWSHSPRSVTAYLATPHRAEWGHALIPAHCIAFRPSTEMRTNFFSGVMSGCGVGRQFLVSKYAILDLHTQESSCVSSRAEASYCFCYRFSRALAKRSGNRFRCSQKTGAECGGIVVCLF